MTQLNIPIEGTTLPNGLRVVISPDRTAPVATVGVYYNIGFRIEPRGRSGFAHLFEHMMFQGSANAGKMVHIKLINSSGGVLNGSTHYDVTNYYESVPSNALERVLWLEADRMRALKVDDENLRNQRDVVKEEVRVNVLNQPYGGFPWLDLPPIAYRNWSNAHNFYGDFDDLDAATLEDVQKFFKTYYAPSNAVLLILGDVDGDDGPDMDAQTPPADTCSTGQACNPTDAPTTMDRCSSSSGCKTGTDAGPPDGTMDAFDPCSVLKDGYYCASDLKGKLSPSGLYDCKMGLLSFVQDCASGCVGMAGTSMCNPSD